MFVPTLSGGAGSISGTGANNLLTLWTGASTLGSDVAGTWTGAGNTFVVGSPTFNASWGHFTGPVVASFGPSQAGGGFTNQPTGDTVTFASSNAGDTTQQITIIGTLAGADAGENILLNGVTPVVSVGTYTKILALVLNGACVGTVTASKTTGLLAITTIAPAALSAGLQTFAAVQGYGKVMQIVASGATTKTVGVGGYAIGGGIQHDPVVMNGTTTTNTTLTFSSAVQFYLGDLENTRTVTLSNISGFDFNNQVYPLSDNVYDLGIPQFRWRTGYFGTSVGVAIGALTPPTNLTVGDTAATSPRGIMSWQSNTGTDGARLHLRKSRGTFGTPTTVVSGDTLGRVVGSGYDGTGFLEMAGINFLSAGTIGTNRIPTQIVFQTATDAAPSVLTTAFTLNEKQQVIILDGTAALPAIAFGTEPTTGIYRAGSSNISFSFAGAQRHTYGAASYGIISDFAKITGGLGSDVTLMRRAAATWQLGAADAASPVAQTLAFQGARATTDTDTAAVAATVQGSLGTGTGASGDIVFKTGTPQTTGTAAHVAATALTLHNAGSAGTAAPQALFADGAQGTPSIGFASHPTGIGITYNSATSLGISSSSSVSAVLGPSDLRLGNAGQIGFGSTTNATAVGYDAYFSRRAAASLSFGGADIASPVAQTFTFQGSRGGTDTDVAGVVATVQGSLGTGTGVAGPISIRTGYPTTTGTTQHVASTRSYTPGAWTTLTETTDTGFATLTFGASSVVGAKLWVTIQANDGTDYQSMSYEVQVNTVRKATGNTVTTVGVLGTPPLVAATTASTLTATFNATEGAGATTINCNATSSLTQTTLRITFQVISNGPGVTVAQL